MPSAHVLDRRAAEAIAKKLKAEITEGRKHQLASVHRNGKLVAAYGIRRDKTASHAHIPSSLSLPLRQVLGLARCPMSADDYFEHLAKLGLLG